MFLLFWGFFANINFPFFNMYIDLIGINKWDFPLLEQRYEKCLWSWSEWLVFVLQRFAAVPGQVVACFPHTKNTKVPQPTLPAGPARSNSHLRVSCPSFFFSNFVTVFSVWAPKCCQTWHVNIYHGHFSKARLTEDSKRRGESVSIATALISARWRRRLVLLCCGSPQPAETRETICFSFLSLLWWSPVVCLKKQKIFLPKKKKSSLVSSIFKNNVGIVSVFVIKKLWVSNYSVTLLIELLRGECPACYEHSAPIWPIIGLSRWVCLPGTLSMSFALLLFLYFLK